MNWFSTCTCGTSVKLSAPELPAHHSTCAKPKATEAEHLSELWLDAVTAGNANEEARLEEAIHKVDARPPRLLDAALVYAQWGWPVFPLVNNQKRPCTRNGFKDATTDAEQIMQWWDRWPTSNIGIATGHLFDVIDIDVPQGVPFWLKLLGTSQDIHGKVTTASGGIHLFIKPTGTGNRAGRQLGVDFRGMGGYVVAAPSTLGPRWRSWSWQMKPSPAIKAGQ